MGEDMKWICKLFGHYYLVNIAEIGWDNNGHHYIAHCKWCEKIKRVSI